MLTVKYTDKEGADHITTCDSFTLDDDETGLARLATFVDTENEETGRIEPKLDGLWCADLVQSEGEAEWRVVITDEDGAIVQEALFRDYDFSADFPWMNKASSE